MTRRVYFREDSWADERMPKKQRAKLVRRVAAKLGHLFKKGRLRK